MEILIPSAHTDNFNLSFVVKVASLHETMDDSSTTFDELKNVFGIEIANAVSELTKNIDLPKENYHICTQIWTSKQLTSLKQN